MTAIKEENKVILDTVKQLHQIVSVATGSRSTFGAINIKEGIPSDEVKHHDNGHKECHFCDPGVIS